MDMKIDSKILINERNSRAWSQQHLAEVSDLNLRTIQRIESLGNASPESIKAIAASFNLEPKNLTIQNRNKQFTFSKVKKLLTLVGVIILVSFFPLSLVSAKPVMLDVKIEKDGSEFIDSSLLSEEGKESEIRVENSLKVLLISEITKEGQVFISLKIFDYSESNGYQLIENPKILTINNKAATIIISGDNGEKYLIEITPHISE